MNLQARQLSYIISFYEYLVKLSDEKLVSYVSLQLRVQNRRRKWNFPLNFRTMHKLYERYSGIFQNY